MKKFSFSLATLLALKRRRLEEARERRRSVLEGERAAQSRAESMRRQALAELAETAGAARLDGARVQAAAAWVEICESRRTEALAAAEKLRAEAEEAGAEALALQREVDLLEKLRERKLTAHRRKADVEAQALADDIHRSRRFQRRKIRPSL